MNPLLLILLLCAGSIRAETLAELTRLARPLLATNGTWKAMAMPKDLAVAVPVTPDNPAAGLIVQVENREAKPWHVMVGRPVTSDLEAGTPCLLVLDARALDSSATNRLGRVGVKLRHDDPPQAAADNRVLTPGAQWKHYVIPFRAAAAIPAGKGALTLSLGYFGQTVEFGPVQVWTFPADFDFQRLEQAKAAPGP